MANIMFKRGLQTNLPATAEDGVFYLTTDTNRLYVGQSSSSAPVLLNQTVQIVGSVSNLPTNPVKNDFYYCTAENILAVYTGTGTYNKDNWKQINPDTNTNDDTKITSGSFGTVDKSTSGELSYTLTLKEKTTDVNGAVSAERTAITAKLTLTAADLESILHDQANVKVVAAASGSDAVIKTSGTGADTSAGVTLVGGSNVTLSTSSNKVTIAADDTKYSISAASNEITLAGTDGSTGTKVSFEGGTGLTASTASNKITFNHDTYTRSDGNVATGTITNNEITVVTDITSADDGTGHVTAVRKTKFTLPDDTKITSVTQPDDWKATITESSGATHNIDFSVEAAALESDLKDHIGTELAKINSALTYKGSVAYGSLPKSNVEVGDVYLLSEDYNPYKIGDMFIATSKSGNTKYGVIASNDLEWTYVPSGDDLNTDTQYYSDVTVASAASGTHNGQVTYGLVAKAAADGSAPALDSKNENLIIRAGTDLALASASGTDSKPIVTLNHKAYSYDPATATATNAASNADFTAITGITVSNGHITGISKQKFTAETYALSGANNVITLKNGSGANCGSIAVGGDSWISAIVDAEGLAVSHATIHGTAGNVSVSNGDALTEEGTFNYISGITYDIAGHVTAVNTTSITMPNDTTYSFASTKGNNPKLVLKSDGGAEQKIGLNGSGSLKVSASATDTITVSLEWGSFTS